MEVIIVRKPEDAAPIVANAYSRLLAAKPDAVLGLATGSTPLGVYKELIRRHKEEGLSFARAKAFNLDEYEGLTGDRPESYRYFMEEHLFRHLDIPAANIHIPDGNAADIPGFCAHYEQQIRDVGGIDIQIPGIGTYVAVDGGMSDNPRPVLYGAGYEAYLPARAEASRDLECTIVGKHCEQGDIVVAGARLPADVAVGDLVEDHAVLEARAAAAVHRHAKHQRAALGLALGDDLVVDVGDVAGKANLDAAPLEIAAQHVVHEGGAAVAEVGRAVHRGAAEIDAQLAWLAHRELANLPGGGVVQAQAHPRTLPISRR